MKTNCGTNILESKSKKFLLIMDAIDVTKLFIQN